MLVLSFRIDPNVGLKIVKPDLQAIGLVQAVIVQSISAPLRRYVFKNLEFLVPAPRRIRCVEIAGFYFKIVASELSS